MRRGYHGKVHRNDDGRLIAVDLGADYCAEHEWGIKGLRQSFGLDEGQEPGIEQYRVRRLPRPASAFRSIGFFYDAKKKQVGSGSDYVRDYKELAPREDEQIAGAWDEGDFLVTFREQQDAVDLALAFEQNDVAFLFANTGGNPFAATGLVLAIISRLPQEYIDGIKAQVLDGIALSKADTETGIKKRLDKASEKATSRSWYKPFGWYALRPSWKGTVKSVGDERDMTATKYPVIYFLNPQDQENAHAGWYTVEELDQWTKGEGPVLGSLQEMREKKAAANKG